MGSEEEKGESKKLATEGWIELKLAAFRAEMRLLFVVAIAGNQVLSHISLGTTATIASNVGLVAAVVIKGMVA